MRDNSEIKTIIIVSVHLQQYWLQSHFVQTSMTGLNYKSENLPDH